MVRFGLFLDIWTLIYELLFSSKTVRWLITNTAPSLAALTYPWSFVVPGRKPTTTLLIGESGHPSCQLQQASGDYFLLWDSDYPYILCRSFSPWTAWQVTDYETLQRRLQHLAPGTTISDLLPDLISDLILHLISEYEFSSPYCCQDGGSNTYCFYWRPELCLAAISRWWEHFVLLLWMTLT